MTGDLPASLRYAKIGPKGSWWKSARAAGQLHAGWDEVENGDLEGKNEVAIRRAIDAHYARRGSVKGVATRDWNALQTLLDRPSQHVWITIEDGCLWWCTVFDDVRAGPASSDERGHFWLTCSRPWNNYSLGGKLLATRDLPGYVSAIAGYRATVCKPSAADKILKIVRGDDDPTVEKAKAAGKAYESAIAGMIDRLHWNDFELLVDLILARGGWDRTEERGKQTKSVDIQAHNLVIGEDMFVQVKGKAGQAELDHSILDFRDRAEQRMIFAVHKHPPSLNAEGDGISLWTLDKIAQLVVRAGLAEWVANRV